MEVKYEVGAMDDESLTTVGPVDDTASTAITVGNTGVEISATDSVAAVVVTPVLVVVLALVQLPNSQSSSGF